MGIRKVNATNFYTAQNTLENQNAERKHIAFTNASDMSKALSSGTVKVDGVTINLSEEALQALSKAREQFCTNQEAEAERYVAELNSRVVEKQREASKDTAADIAKALETARRIANGDIVPAIDEKKLLECNEELYRVAKASAMLHEMEEHRKDKSLYENAKEREYTDSEAETAPQQKYGVELEVSLGDTPAVESISGGLQ